MRSTRGFTSALRGAFSTWYLLTRFQLGGNQSHFVDAGRAHDVDGPRDVHEQYIVIAFDESYFLSAILEDLFHTRTQAVPVSILAINFQLSVLGNLHHHGLVIQFLIFVLV